MGIPLLVEYFNELPQRGEEENAKGSVARFRKSLEDFKLKVAIRYSEGTLQRLLHSSDTLSRRASVLALGMIGSMPSSNKPVAALLRDSDPIVRQLASDAMWALWFRADSEENNLELQRAIRGGQPSKALANLEALIQKSPRFAEAFNQRAIIHFRLGEYQKSIADCERVLKLNPLHFGALAGMGQCFMKLHKPRQALKAFRSAYRINPGLEGVEHTIRTLEDVLGEEGRKDDKK